MGNTVWVLRESSVDEGDDWDHSLLLNAAEVLDAEAERLGVKKLSEFFDWADMEFNLSDEELPESWIAEHRKWYAPDEAIATLHALKVRVEEGDIPGVEVDTDGLIEEIDDCLGKLQAAREEGDRIHLCIVM